MIHRLGLACYRASVSVQRAAAALSRAWSKRTSSPGPATAATAAPDAPAAQSTVPVPENDDREGLTS